MSPPPDPEQTDLLDDALRQLADAIELVADHLAQTSRPQHADETTLQERTTR
jgi:predicted RNase H-like HicB family nuclease